ncbi:hypothetical protein D3C75_1023650 [compost metagenome]
MSTAVMRYMPMALLPKVVVTQPIRYGEQKPARLAKLFTAAMPAAADTPPSSVVGSIQNSEEADSTPAAARHRLRIDSVRLLPSAAARLRPSAPISMGIARCQRRSR